MISYDDYRLNAEQAQTTQGGNRFTAPEQQVLQGQYNQDVNREKSLGDITAYEKGQNPYYASLYDSLRGAGVQQAQSRYNDSLKHSQLAAAGRGLTGSSVEQSGQARLGGQLQQDVGQASANAQNTVQGIRSNDLNYTNSLRNSLYASSPYMQAYYANLAQAQQQAGIAGQAGASLQYQAQLNNQQAQNDRSQVYGGAIGAGLGAVTSAFGAA